jgi:hypothetical protein
VHEASIQDRDGAPQVLASIRSRYPWLRHSRDGDVIAALAMAGVFRLRGVLVGTVAYQTYAAMLGVRLSAGPLQTGDIDIAQFKNVSVAIGDSTPPALDVLKEVDKTFRAIPHVVDGRRVTSYTAKGD